MDQFWNYLEKITELKSDVELISITPAPSGLHCNVGDSFIKIESVDVVAFGLCKDGTIWPIYLFRGQIRWGDGQSDVYF